MDREGCRLHGRCSRFFRAFSRRASARRAFACHSSSCFTVKSPAKARNSATERLPYCRPVVAPGDHLLARRAVVRVMGPDATMAHGSRHSCQLALDRVGEEAFLPPTSHHCLAPLPSHPADRERGKLSSDPQRPICPIRHSPAPGLGALLPDLQLGKAQDKTRTNTVGVPSEQKSDSDHCRFQPCGSAEVLVLPRLGGADPSRNLPRGRLICEKRNWFRFLARGKARRGWVFSIFGGSKRW